MRFDIRNGFLTKTTNENTRIHVSKQANNKTTTTTTTTTTIPANPNHRKNTHKTTTATHLRPHEGAIHCQKYVNIVRLYFCIVSSSSFFPLRRREIVCVCVCFFFFGLMITYIALFSALLSRLTALACGST